LVRKWGDQVRGARGARGDQDAKGVEAVENGEGDTLSAAD